LSKEEWASIVERPCAVCGTRKTVGVDRIDPTQPYNASNTMPLCWECNRAKGPMTIGEFREWLDRVFAWSGRAE
jgi:5-methylcytosine-specific restriction endonuclease McrA